jgi:very-short-patch-repair endonuclease
MTVAPDWNAAPMEPKDLMLAAIAGEADGVFTLDHARLCKFTDAEIEFRARFVWLRLYAGVFRWPGAPETWKGNLRAAVFAGEPNAVLSHRSAAALYELPGGRVDLAELTCPRWRRSQTHGLVIHESTFVHPNDVHLIDDLPTMRPERTVFELASIYRSADFIERVLHAARRKRLITYDSTMRTFRRLAGRGRHGVVVMRTALERWERTAATTESDMETRLLQVLRRRGLPEPVLQYEVYDETGRFVARADAALVEHRILIEYDSMQEHSDEWSLARDARRRNRLVGLGYHPLVARYDDVRSGGDDLVDAVRACMRLTA